MNAIFSGRPTSFGSSAKVNSYPLTVRVNKAALDLFREEVSDLVDGYPDDVDAQYALKILNRRSNAVVVRNRTEAHLVWYHLGGACAYWTEFNKSASYLWEKVKPLAMVATNVLDTIVETLELSP